MKPQPYIAPNNSPHLAPISFPHIAPTSASIPPVGQAYLPAQGPLKLPALKRTLILLLALPLAALAQEKGESSGLKAWEWANFILLAAGLGYVIGKNAGPAFEARSRKIRREMVEAAEMKQEADARAADVERRLANLETEIAALRAEARQEEQAEVSRYAQQTTAEIAKVQARSEQEIAAAGKAARLELKRHAAKLALDLAEVRLQARMTPQTEEALVGGFVRNLDKVTRPRN